MLPHLPGSLTALHLQLYPLTDAGCSTLAARCPRLRSCEVLQVCGLTHAGVAALASGLTGLRELSLGLEFNKECGDAGAWARALCGMRQLTGLRLGGLGRPLVAALGSAPGQLGGMVGLCSLELSAAAGPGGDRPLECAPALLREVRCLTRLTSLQLQRVACGDAVQEVAAALPFVAGRVGVLK